MKSASMPNPPPQHAHNPFTVILRSFCVGIAAVVAAFFAWMFGALFLGLYLIRKVHPPAGGEVGFDLVTLVHNSPISAKVLAPVAFVIGFAAAFRYFSRPPRGAKNQL